MEVIILVFAFIIFFSFSMGWFASDDAPAMALSCLVILALTSWGEYYLIGSHFSPSVDASKFSGNYLIKERFVSKEKRNVVILYSISNDREQIVEIRDWPPAGYSETLVEGETMIVPTPK